MPLSDAKIRTLKPKAKAYRLADRDGLVLEVRPSGKLVWRLRFRLQGKASMANLGQYPMMRLSQAREACQNARELVAQGVNPSHHQKAQRAERHQQQATTLRQVAEQWYAEMRKEWGESYRGAVRRGLNKDIYPVLGDRPISEIRAYDVRELLLPIKERGATTVAINCNLWLSQIFRYGVSNLYCEQDPTQAVKGILRRGQIRHAVALRPFQLATLLARVDRHGGYQVTQSALQLLMLIGVRGIEMRRAKWRDIHFRQRLWIFPKENMKKRHAKHVVPMSDQVVRILEELQEITGGKKDRPVLPGLKRPTDMIHHTTLNGAIQRMGFTEGAFATHGFRSTMSTILNEHKKAKGWEVDAIEMLLHHKVGQPVRGIYNHALYLDERREILQWWGDYTDALRPEVLKAAFPDGEDATLARLFPDGEDPGIDLTLPPEALALDLPPGGEAALTDHLVDLGKAKADLLF